jgi:transposase
MSMRELDRLKVVEAVIEQRLMPWRAAERLGISRRQIERLVARYRAGGPLGLVSQRRGHASNHQLPEDRAHRALSLIRERYADFGPTLACETLWECHGLQLSHPARIDRCARKRQQRIRLRPQHVRNVFQRVIAGSRVKRLRARFCAAFGATDGAPSAHDGSTGPLPRCARMRIGRVFVPGSLCKQ